MQTPSTRSRRGNIVSSSDATLQASTPLLVPRGTTNTKRPIKPKAVETVDKIVEEEVAEDEPAFNGHATMRAGDLSATVSLVFERYEEDMS